MVKLFCEKCGYRFESRYLDAERCPYCGKDGVEVEPNAEELIEGG